jgi:hypothetical protein
MHSTLLALHNHAVTAVGGVADMADALHSTYMHVHTDQVSVHLSSMRAVDLLLYMLHRPWYHAAEPATPYGLQEGLRRDPTCEGECKGWAQPGSPGLSIHAIHR